MDSKPIFDTQQVRHVNKATIYRMNTLFANANRKSDRDTYTHSAHIETRTQRARIQFK